MRVGRQLTIGFATVISATVLTGTVAVLALNMTVTEKDEVARVYAEDLAHVESLRYRAEQVSSGSDVAAADEAFQRSLAMIMPRSPREEMDLQLVRRAWLSYLVASMMNRDERSARSELHAGLDKLVEDERIGWAEAFEHSRSSAHLAGLLVVLTTVVGVAASVWLAGVLRKRLVAALSAREEVLAVVSHDLRNPLTSILMNSGSLARQAHPDAAAKLSRIHGSAERMNQLIEELLDAVRSDTGRLVLQKQPCALTTLVEGTLKLFEEQAAEKSVRLRAELPERLDITGDARRLGRVLTNLLGNALKFTPPGGEVTVRAARTPTGAELTVGDTGPGITPDQLPHLFEKHWQAKKSTGGGLGLGLYIVKRLVEAHGGDIDVESTPGKGCTFRVKLPQ